MTNFRDGLLCGVLIILSYAVPSMAISLSNISSAAIHYQYGPQCK